MANSGKRPTPKKSRPERAAEQKLTKDYGLLAEQPLSVAGLDRLTRNNVVISAVMDGNKERVLSRYGDLLWEMWPFVTVPNVRENEKRLDWSRIPAAYRDVCMSVVFRYWRVGTKGSTLPGVSSLVCLLYDLATFCRFLEASGVGSMADVHPIHIANYVHAQKSRGIAATTLVHRFSAIEKLYAFRDQHPEGLRIHPWPESSAYDVAGFTGHGRKDAKRDGKTPLIPAAVAQALFLHAEGILKTADTVLEERDHGLRSAWHDPEVTAIRNACFYLLGVLTGMRSSELSSIEVGAGRAEVKNGYTYHWIKSVEHKTKKRLVEYLMPSMGHDILRVLERSSEPYRGKLAAQLADWEADTEHKSAKRLQQIASARANLNKLFLGNSIIGIVPVSNVGWTRILKSFAKDARVDWDLAAHQMRRLYAYTFVRHRLGGLLFLKEQFKHSSIDMSQLYAANPNQDAALYDEILEEVRLRKIETIAGWMDGDELLAGGAGKKIMALRALDFPSRASMIEETADKINIRSNGHAWCLAQDEGCGGVCGVYEKTRCSGCRTSVIDSRFMPFWQETYRHSKELLVEARKLGPGATKRVQRDIEAAERVLADLGVELPMEVQDDNAAAP
ncbi:MAG: site-specific integrase [Sterolibacterium sp.]